MINLRYCIYYILILILLLQFYIIIIYNIFKTDHNNCKYNKIYKKILFSDLYPYFKTGDLLFFSFNDVDILTRGFINYRFPHMAMIYENNGKLYTLEIIDKDSISPYDKTNYTNFNMFPLDQRIKYYSGTVYYSSLIKELSINKKNKLDNFINRANNYTYASSCRLLLIFLLHYSKVDIGNRFCSEFVAELLHILDISSKPYNSTKFNLTETMLDLTNNTIYTNPVFIISDEFMIKDIKNSNYITYC